MLQLSFAPQLGLRMKTKLSKERGRYPNGRLKPTSRTVARKGGTNSAFHKANLTYAGVRKSGLKEAWSTRVKAGAIPRNQSLERAEVHELPQAKTHDWAEDRQKMLVLRGRHEGHSGQSPCYGAALALFLASRTTRACTAGIWCAHHLRISAGQGSRSTHRALFGHATASVCELTWRSNAGAGF